MQQQQLDGEESDQSENGAMSKVRLDTAQLKHDVTIAQSENKQQYKRLADALGKSDSYGKVQAALSMDKHLKGKGKKRKTEDEEGRVTYKWFAQRKR